jgi:hypothetical protein
MMQSNNLYVYCINNPLRYVDPAGLEAVRPLPQPRPRLQLLPPQPTNPTPSFWTRASAALKKFGPYAVVAGGTQIIIDAYAGFFEADLQRQVAEANLRASLAQEQVARIQAQQREIGYGYFAQFACDVAGIASNFRDFECDKAADAIVEYLERNNRRGVRITLTFPNARHGFVISYSRNGNYISDNGFHEGVLYNGLVYCNIHPHGLPEAAWIADFDAIPPKIITRTPF